MDPITSGLNLLGKVLDFGMLVYQDTPVPLRQQGAADWAKFFHNVSTQILELQQRITQVPLPSPGPEVKP